MKKILISFMAILFIITMFNVSFAADEPTALVVHYYRYDDNYSDFNIWLWQKLPNSGEGEQFSFSNSDVDDHGAYLEVDLTSERYAGATQLGIIIKKGGWDDYREPGGDRLFMISDIQVKGTSAHIYFVQGDEEFGLSDDDLANNIPDYRDRILGASFNTSIKVEVQLTSVGQSYRLLENDVEVTNGPVTSSNFTINYSNFDLGKSYRVEVDFGGGHIVTSDVSLHRIYDSAEFTNQFTYEGTLGAIYSKTSTTFRLWAPLSENVVLNLYEQGHPEYSRLGVASNEPTPYETHEMTKIENGVWQAVISGDLASIYYTFSVTNGGKTNEVTDPYSFSTGANGLRSMVVNFDSTDPYGWNTSSRPNTITNFTDYIVWELHVRDLTTHSSWNGSSANRGKFLGITESGTTYTKNGVTVSTGLDHIVELGVNAVQLLPIFDFGYVDEVEAFKNPNYSNIFNWGYMPYHFNTLEGSYSTNPFDGNVRIYEFKQVVQTLHNNDIRVIMDVVYNHTGQSGDSNFNLILPGYYHRLTEDGGFANGSGTGNETASERSMVRKFMLDSTVFLATEYKLSGFRFDLMALHDIDTMNLIREELDKIDPTIVLYGEPWTGGDSPIDGDIAAGMTPGNNWNNKQILKLDGVGAFNDTSRDAIKGDTGGTATTPGFIQGNSSAETINNIKYGITGGTGLFTSTAAWHGDPNKTINYVAAHDNHTLHDKLRQTKQSGESLQAQLIQANAIILTSQGVPFIHAGEEFARSKPLVDGSGYDENSYESPDAVNQLRWDRKVDYIDVFNYFKALIQIRRIYPHFRLGSVSEIQDRFEFLNVDQAINSIAYKISGVDGQPDIVVIHANKAVKDFAYVTLNDGKQYIQLTSYMQHNLGGLVEQSEMLFALPSSTSIYVEKMDSSSDAVNLINMLVTVDQGASFNPLSNVNMPSSSHAFASNYYNTSVPGFYPITVNVYDSSSNLQGSFTYILHVNNNKLNVTVNRG